MGHFIQISFASLVTWPEQDSFSGKEGRHIQHKYELHFYMG